MNLLVTKNDIVDNCALSENTDDRQINVAIVQAHNKLQAVLCRDFYEELKTQFLNSTLSTENTAIFPYVKNYLVWESYSSFIVVGSFNQTKAGFREHTDDNSQPVDNTRISMIKKNAEEQAQFYLGELRRFLHDNIGDYSTYQASNCYDCDPKKYSFKISGAGSKERPDPWFDQYPYNT